eukprot:TRINITY_DN433_c2_g3_i1.p1 TRINITY_DN433_c2_g3~~TRINITY_DN433_c2_g3_i1.p1  ORF type:complete len:522 (-),score=110.82 TRINITY_DN433_c2_g3_i1:77-1642(-)
MDLWALRVVEAYFTPTRHKKEVYDPFVRLTVGGVNYETSVLKGGHGSPKWNDLISLQSSEEDARFCKVQLIEKSPNSFTASEVIGSGTFDRSSLSEGEPAFLSLDSGEHGYEVKLVLLLPSIEDTSKRYVATKSKQAKKQIQECLEAGGQGPLDLSALELKGLPKEMMPLEMFLGELDISFNDFYKFPEVSMFQKLQTLHLRGNQITVVEPNMLNLPSLLELTLTGNQIESFPNTVSQMVSLERLDLSNNKLVSIPATIGTLDNLEDLMLSGNAMLSHIPVELGALRRLEALDLSFCSLTAVPKEFANLAGLMELNLSNNKLTTLPSTFGLLTRLVTLNLSDNQLQDLPMSMGYCQTLASCIMGGNQFKSKEMVRRYGQGIDFLVEYLQSRMDDYLLSKGLDEYKARQMLEDSMKMASPAVGRANVSALPSASSSHHGSPAPERRNKLSAGLSTNSGGLEAHVSKELGRESSQTSIGGDASPNNSRQSSTQSLGGDSSATSQRSEERRVGKECRSRWSPYH